MDALFAAVSAVVSDWDRTGPRTSMKAVSASTRSVAGHESLGQLAYAFEGGLEAEVEAMAAAQVQEKVARAKRRPGVVHQFVKCDGHILQATCLLDEEQHGIPSRHAPQLLMHLGPMAEEVVQSTLRDDLQKEQRERLNIYLYYPNKVMTGVCRTSLSSSPHCVLQPNSFNHCAAGTILLKELEAGNKEELLQEDLRIEDGNVGRPTNKGVGCVGQGVNDIISHEVTVFVLKYWQQQVLNHLRIHRTWCGREKRAE
ncbi:hypothetical protein EYF80_026821 [Liparis tanakae]|uniref:Uncharacterized protein n=1 Tax=Liparis tanakae TaxID=230148 RepID=A0A4Z2HBD6_9TELE|nr:hypothetical protein EYF80_026821 [Liparis tanakae]